MDEEKTNPLIEMLRKHGAWKTAVASPGILITEPITEENFKDFQRKLRSLVPPKLLEKWDKEDGEAK